MTPHEETKTQQQGTTARVFTGDDWRTPIEILELIFEVFGGDVTLDPCANRDPDYQFAKYNWTFPDHDGANEEWTGPAFWNPPYSKAGAWVEHAHHQYLNGVPSIGLISPSTDTAYWHDHVFGHEHIEASATRVCFFAGRIDFLAPEGMTKVRGHRGIWEYDAAAPWVPHKINRYASAFVLYGGEYEAPFCRVFERVGRVVRP